jgi:RHS repeat-associated protein
MFRQLYTCNTLKSNGNSYPFGMQMPGRQSPLIAGDEHRYGFNGMEMDDEVKSERGTSYDFGARMYDPRVGRWLSRDPLAAKYAEISPYVYTINNPILLIDPNGKEVVLYNEKGQKVATISKAGLVIEKGMGNSAILHAYIDTKEYLKGHLETDVFSEFENSQKVLSIKQVLSVDGTAVYSSPEVKEYRGRDINGDGEIVITELQEIEQVDPSSLGTISWNPTTGAVDNEGNYHSPALVFIHELFHGKHWKDDPVKMTIRRETKAGKLTNLEEKLTIAESNKVSESLYQDLDSTKDKLKRGHRNTDGGNGGRKTHQGLDGYAFRSPKATSNTAIGELITKPIEKVDNTNVVLNLKPIE